MVLERMGSALAIPPSPCFGTPKLLKQATTGCGRLSVDVQEPISSLGWDENEAVLTVTY